MTARSTEKTAKPARQRVSPSISPKSTPTRTARSARPNSPQPKSIAARRWADAVSVRAAPNGPCSSTVLAAKALLMRGRLPFAPPPGGFEHAGPGGPDRKPGEALSKSDFVNQGLARFDKADTDHDGNISAAERDAARPMRGPRGARNMPPAPSDPKVGAVRLHGRSTRFPRLPPDRPCPLRTEPASPHLHLREIAATGA